MTVLIPPRSSSAPGWMQVVWLLAATATLLLAGTGLTLIYQQSQLVTIPQFREFLAEVGVELNVATLVSFVLPVVMAAVLAAIVFVAKRSDSFALLFALATLGFFVLVTGSPRAVAMVYTQLAPVATLFEVGFVVLVVFMFLLFPNGRFQPAWSRPVAYLLALICIVMPWLPATLRMMAVDTGAIAPYRKVTATAVALVLVGSTVAAQVVRYRQYASPLERQQIRWVLFGFLVMFVPGSGVAVAVMASAGRVVAWLLLAMAVTAPVLPVTAAIAILRFRLFELDRVISLTVSWATLSILLAGFYLLSVISFQTVLRPMTGESDLAVAASTLAVAALFAPARRQIQRLVDRQFHRARYNAERTIERFSQRLRDQLDSGTLTRNLTDVAIDTFEPARVSVWLRS